MAPKTARFLGLVKVTLDLVILKDPLTNFLLLAFLISTFSWLAALGGGEAMPSCGDFSFS
uniref:Uncharacterized protein n=1 Tax=Candidozyma auris TaxID=498019 RepID=A0A0L0NTX2_CANAR